MGYRVLFIDMDSQEASSTSSFGYIPDWDIRDESTLLPYFKGEIFLRIERARALDRILKRQTARGRLRIVIVGSVTVLRRELLGERLRARDESRSTLVLCRDQPASCPPNT